MASAPKSVRINDEIEKIGVPTAYRAAHREQIAKRAAISSGLAALPCHRAVNHSSAHFAILVRGPAVEMLASGAGSGQSLLFHLLGCVACRVPLGNPFPVRDIVGC
jgi:hypothetical protein